jgi:hypothetical protein
VSIVLVAIIGGLTVPRALADDELPDCFARGHATCADFGPHALPRSPDELIALRDEIAHDPWGGAAVAIYALMSWHADPVAGQSMLVLAVSERNVGKVGGSAATPPPGTHKGYALSGALRALLKMGERSRHCARSYAVGATPDNRYSFDPAAVTLRFRKQEKAVGSIESGTYKVFACTAGADSCRPITMKRNRHGLWKADELSSLLTGCKAMAPLPTDGGPEDDL